MRRDQRNYIRALRGKLGGAMRAADDVIFPLKAQLEVGERWEPDETVTAQVAIDDLAEVATAINAKLKGMLNHYGKSLSTSSRTRLEVAYRGINKGVQALEGISGREVLKRELDWIEGRLPWKPGDVLDIKESHEAYILARYNLGMKLLREGWNKMFFATQEASPRRIKLTERETRAFHDPMSDVRVAIEKQAIREAKEHGRVVEVVDSSGELLLSKSPDSQFIEAQSASLIERGRKAKRADWSYKGRREAGQVLHLAEATPEEALAVQEVIARRPGTSLREAAAEVGVEVVPYPAQPMAPNASEDRSHKQDVEIQDALWAMDLDDY